MTNPETPSNSQTNVLTPRVLTAEIFAKFGDVIEVNEKHKHHTINDGFCERYHDLAKLDLSREQGTPLINIFRSTPLQQPVSLKMMERHPLSSQAFYPLGTQPYLVVVAPCGDFNVNAIEVFLASANQGVNYNAGTWHHYCLALHQVSDFLVIDRGGAGDNCDVVTLDGSIQITQC